MKDYKKSLLILNAIVIDYSSKLNKGIVPPYCGEAMGDIQFLVDKEKPMKPIANRNEGHKTFYRCPHCGKDLPEIGSVDYCPHCGQHLDWGNDNKSHSPTDAEKEDIFRDGKK